MNLTTRTNTALTRKIRLTTNLTLLIATSLLFGICDNSFAQVVEQEPTTTETVQDEEQPKEEIRGYGFEILNSVDVTEVKSQDSTGTCWCFATASFMESEALRIGKGQHNFSEMFVVRNIYKQKAFNYVHRSGKANFSEGALAHDFMNAVNRHGLVPEEVFDGLDDGVTRHSHGEMVKMLEGILKVVLEQRKPSGKWKVAFDRILDVYLGSAPEEFSYQGKSYTPKEFAASVGFHAKDYVNLTSYSHHPFYDSFVLEIPDNFSNGSFYNVPIDELVATIDNALANGYSVAWDGDVSERGFSRDNGLAILPKNRGTREMFREPGEEVDVTQELRQTSFEDHTTTDDHLMHLTGVAKDKNGNKYYLIKNSWGEVGKHKGYLYMSEAYVRLKTVAILVHKDALVDTKALKPPAITKPASATVNETETEGEK